MLSLTLNNHKINIRCDEELIDFTKNNIFSTLITSSNSDDCDFEITSDENNFLLKDQEKITTVSETVNELIYNLEWRIVDYLIEQHRNLYQFHGASVAWQNNGYTFIGNPGTGKTSLSILLMKNDFLFFSDEVSLINQKDHCLSPFPRNLIIKQHLLDKITIDNNALPLTIDNDDDKKEKAYFLSPQIFGKPVLESVQLKKIFFLHHADKIDFQIEKIGQHEAFNQLIPQLFNPQILNSEPEKIIELINSAECYNLYLSKPLYFSQKQINDLTNQILNG